MAITNYTELQSTIADFLNRDDLTAVIPTFISLAEAEFNRRLRHWRMERRSNAVCDTQYSALPSDFLEPIRLQIKDTAPTELSLISMSEMLDRRDLQNDTAGRPKYYAIVDGTIEVYPTPDAEYTLEMVYYSRIDALSVSNTSNWLLNYHPDAYLYGSLAHSAPYLSEDARIQIWAGLLQSAIDGIMREDEKAKYGGSGHRIKIRSY